MLDIFGNRNICLVRELTKKYEEYLRGNIKEILEVVDEIKGEMVVVVEGKKEDEIVKELNNLSVKEHYNYYINNNIDPKTAIKKVAKDLKLSSSTIYQEIKGKNK